MLKICTLLFNQLNLDSIRYCHWKSNCRLQKSLIGQTDLDILVHKDDQLLFEAALKKFNCKKIFSSQLKRIKNVDDYLGLDYETGKLIHLHVHYELVLGEKYVKNYSLPIEEVIFKNLISKYNVMIPCPEIELLILIIRANMKLGNETMARYTLNIFRKSNTPYPYDIETEINELISECNMIKFESLQKEINLPLTLEFFKDFINKISKKEAGLLDFIKWKNYVFNGLKDYKRENNFNVNIRYYLLYIQNLPLINKYAKKKLLEDGKIISIVGADGSGKSTIVAELQKWLSWKLQTGIYYYGIPKAKWLKKLDWLISASNRFKCTSMAKMLYTLFCIIIARIRYNIFNQIQSASSQGIFVITDRFPLKEFRTMKEPMDGPRLFIDQSAFCQKFADIEENYYNLIRPPDRIFVLQADIEELRRRKSNLSYEKHKEKAQAVNRINESSIITLIDANRPYSEVLLKIKRKIWEIL